MKLTATPMKVSFMHHLLRDLQGPHMGVKVRDPSLMMSHQQMRGLAAWLLLRSPYQRREEEERSQAQATLAGQALGRLYHLRCQNT